MRFILKLIDPDGTRHEEKLDWDGDLSYKEGLQVEKVTGAGLDEFFAAMQGGKRSLAQLGTIIYILKRRQDPTYRYEDLDFVFSDLETESDEPEPKVDPLAGPPGSTLSEPSTSSSSPSSSEFNLGTGSG